VIVAIQGGEATHSPLLRGFFSAKFVQVHLHQDGRDQIDGDLPFGREGVSMDEGDKSLANRYHQALLVLELGVRFVCFISPFVADGLLETGEQAVEPDAAFSPKTL